MLISDVVCEQGHMALRKCSSWYPCYMEWFAEIFVLLTACTSFSWMFSLTLHLNLCQFDFPYADFTFLLLLSGEASLKHLVINYCRCWECFHWLPMWTCLVLIACLLAPTSYCEAASWRSNTQIPTWENHEGHFSHALATPKRYPRDTCLLSQIPWCESVCDTFLFSGDRPAEIAR